MNEAKILLDNLSAIHTTPMGQTASGEIFLLDKKLKMLLPGAATRFAKKKVKSAAREKTGTAKLTAASLQLMHTVTQ